MNSSLLLFVVLSLAVVFLAVRNFVRLKADVKAQAEHDVEEETARRARQGPDFKRGAGKKETSLLLYGPPDSEGLQDVDRNLPSQEFDAALDAAVANRDQGRLENLRLGGSRFGGVPDMPLELVWPMFEGKKLTFLAQIDLSELPKSLLPLDGWLFVFGLYDGVHEPPPVVVAYHRGPRENLLRAPQPGRDEIWSAWDHEVTYQMLPLVASLEKAGKPGVTRKDWDEKGHFFGDLEQDEEYESAASIADAQDRSGDDWITLLVIPSVGSMCWSDSGVFHIAIRRQDLIRQDFGNVCAEICCVG